MVEFLKYYDFTLQYHPSKSSLTLDALSRKRLHVSTIMINYGERDDVSFSKRRIHLGLTTVTNDFIKEFQEKQTFDEDL